MWNKKIITMFFYKQLWLSDVYILLWYKKE